METSKLPSYTVVHSDQVYSQDEQWVWKKLWEYNWSRVDKKHRPSEIYNRIYKGDSGAIMASIFCESFFNYIFVKLLWVDEIHRGSGLGLKLLQGAEDHALKIGCTHSYLDTFSFQAADFYTRFGYSEFGVLNDFPPGHSRHFFVKVLN